MTKRNKLQQSFCNASLWFLKCANRFRWLYIHYIPFELNCITFVILTFPRIGSYAIFFNRFFWRLDWTILKMPLKIPYQCDVAFLSIIVLTHCVSYYLLYVIFINQTLTQSSNEIIFHESSRPNIWVDRVPKFSLDREMQKSKLFRFVLIILHSPKVIYFVEFFTITLPLVRKFF